MPSQELIDCLNKGKWKAFDNFILSNQDKFSPFFIAHYNASWYRQRMYTYYKTCLKWQDYLTDYAKKCVNELAYQMYIKYNCRVEYLKLSYK